jgi:hypothetical protein
VTKPAELKVASGPDRGKIFPLVEETVNLGCGDDNEIILDDDQLAETHLSITRKNNRYAIYTPFEGAIEIDGNTLPSEQWVWLPTTARIQITSRTVLQFNQPLVENKIPTPVSNKKVETKAPDQPPTPTPQREGSQTVTRSVSEGQLAESENSSSTSQSNISQPIISQSNASQTKVSRKPKTKKSPQASVAKFITNREGDALVQLGADGKLPELSLQEDRQTSTKTTKKKASNPNILYAALAASFFVSIMILLLDTSGFETAPVKVESVRKDITKFYEKPGQEPHKYQLELRQAELAHAKADYKKEKLHYRRVLFMLQAQDTNPLKGLTGDGPTTDEELKTLVISLLGQKVK